MGNNFYDFFFYFAMWISRCLPLIYFYRFLSFKIFYNILTVLKVKVEPCNVLFALPAKNVCQWIKSRLCPLDEQLNMCGSPTKVRRMFAAKHVLKLFHQLMKWMGNGWKISKDWILLWDFESTETHRQSNGCCSTFRNGQDTLSEGQHFFMRSKLWRIVWY